MGDTMNAAHAVMAEGDYEAAAAMLAPSFAQTSDVAEGVMLLYLQCALYDFAGAKATLDRALGLAPHLGPLLGKVKSCASAEWTRNARLSRTDVAGKRAAFATPPPFAMLYAKAEYEHAAQDFAAAKATLEQIATTRPRVSGVATTMQGKELPFVDLFDTDDLIGATFPVYHEGTIYDLPYAELTSLEFLAKGDPFYGLWPSVAFETRFGAHGVAPFPAMYAGSSASTDRTIRLGRLTSFNHDRGYAIAEGLRDLWVIGGDGSRRMMGIPHFARIRFG